MKSEVFWRGYNGLEFISWRGSTEVFVYSPYEFPYPPSEIIRHTKRIETEDEFDNVIQHGKRFRAVYKEI
ncbi:hypothetical protein [Paenibacillus donghaensis]|uniref:hypothetical protein n=1 Tax=Paenibacillus donghaensis TaxID=414771 RepID=UPI0012FD0DF0|nr:hypothetical protein [Paenibacillus donghaensis]